MASASVSGMSVRSGQREVRVVKTSPQSCSTWSGSDSGRRVAGFLEPQLGGKSLEHLTTTVQEGSGADSL